MKHFDVKHQFLREKICKHVTSIEYISMNCMLANPLIKGLAIVMYHDQVINMGFTNPYHVLG